MYTRNPPPRNLLTSCYKNVPTLEILYNHSALDLHRGLVFLKFLGKNVQKFFDVFAILKSFQILSLQVLEDHLCRAPLFSRQKTIAHKYRNIVDLHICQRFPYS